MPVHMTALGAELNGEPVTITTRQCLAYAAGIGDVSPYLFDDLSPDFMAAPQMCVSLEWPWVSHPDISKAYACAPEERGRGVHYIQDSLFHRPIRPGDELTTDLKIIGIEPTRAGTQTIIEIVTRDQTGEPVVTSWTTSVMRDVAIEGDPKSLSAPLPWPEAGTAGETTSTPIWIATELPHVYTECAAIWNPIHTERGAAKAVDLPDVILHGTATWALAGREIIKAYGDGNPARLKRLSGKFGAMVMPGTEITVVHQAAETTDGDLLVTYDVKNPDGSPAMRGGMALVSRD